MANAKISDAAFQAEDNVRLISGIPGYKTGTPNTNVKITGQELVTSVINQSGSGIDKRVTYYAASGPNVELAGSDGFTWSDDTTNTLTLGLPGNFAGNLVINSNHVAGTDPGTLTFSTKDGDNFQIYAGNTVSDQTWILPGSLPSSGEVLTASVTGTDVSLFWNAPGGIDFSSLDISTIKADITQSSQPQYGSAITVKAKGAISNGDIVVFNYDLGEVRGEVASTLPAQNTVAGVAIEDIADGATGKVLIYGYATVKYNNFIPPSPAANIALTSSVSGNTTVLTPGVVQPFSDSGGTGDYQNSETYTYIFDSGDDAEQIQLTVNSFDFEGTGSSAFDRLGFQEADDESGPYVNCAFSPGPDIASYNKGWRRMNETNWQSGGGVNNDVTQGPYADGYVLPANNSAGGFTLPQTFTSTKRYVKCFFYSDSGVPSDGWDIDFETTATVSPTNTPIAGRASLDISDLAAATNQLGTGRTIGITVGGTFADNSAVIFVEPPRVQ